MLSSVGGGGGGALKLIFLSVWMGKRMFKESKKLIDFKVGKIDDFKQISNTTNKLYWPQNLIFTCAPEDLWSTSSDTK